MNRLFRLGMMLVGCIFCSAAFAQTISHQWVETYRLEGVGTAQSAPFKLWSDRWEISYTPHGEVPFEVTLVDLGTKDAKTITSQEGHRAQPGAAHGKGKLDQAFLSIKSPCTTWSIVIRQYMDRIDEWQFRQWKGLDALLKPHSSWCGTAGDRLFTLDLTACPARIKFIQKHRGFVLLTISAPNGDVVSRFSSTMATERELWLNIPQKYTVEVTASDTDWELHVDAAEPPPQENEP